MLVYRGVLENIFAGDNLTVTADTNILSNDFYNADGRVLIKINAISVAAILKLIERDGTNTYTYEQNDGIAFTKHHEFIVSTLNGRSYNLWLDTNATIGNLQIFRIR